jgi:hypothetical protein
MSLFSRIAAASLNFFSLKSLCSGFISTGDDMAVDGAGFGVVSDAGKLSGVLLLIHP